MSWRAPPGPLAKAVSVPASGCVVAKRRVTLNVPPAGRAVAEARTVPVASDSSTVSVASRLRPVTVTGLATVWWGPGEVTTMAPPPVAVGGFVVAVASLPGAMVVLEPDGTDDPGAPAATVEVADAGPCPPVVGGAPVDPDEPQPASTRTDRTGADRTTAGPTRLSTARDRLRGLTGPFLCMTRPTPDDLRAAAGRTIPDLVGPDLHVLFCGINPGLWSGAARLHFARPGNRFWKVLHGAGFTDRVLDPAEQAVLPALGIGITNLVSRTTAAAAELGPDELRAGAARLERKVRRLCPRFVAFVGMQAYRTAFRRPKAVIGRQPEALGGAPVWLLPNPSGLQARYQLGEMVEAYAALRAEAFGTAASGPPARGTEPAEYLVPRGVGREDEAAGMTRRRR